MSFKELRQKSNFDVKSAAEALEISVHTLYKIEEGRRNPSTKLIRRMCSKYGSSISEVFELLDV